MNLSTRATRAVGIARGLALGDALGAPASEHRTVRDPWVRSMLRQGATDLDSSQVVRPVVPFVLSSIGSDGAAALVGTDDAEGFAIAARVVVEAQSWSADDLFDTWRELMDDDVAWMGPSQRSALLNAKEGLRPPQTGADNPAFYDDTALPGAIAVGIAASSLDDAGVLARRLASITHDGVGVEAAVATARLIWLLLDGKSLEEGIELVRDDLEVDGWLGDGVRDAFGILDSVSSPFRALPQLIARFAPRTYSHPGTVAETLPLALALVHATDGDHERAIPLALAVSRHQDSLPALVGALCGALGTAIADSGIDELQGVLVPTTRGRSVTALAEQASALTRSV